MSEGLPDAAGESSRPAEGLRRADWRFLFPGALDRPFRRLLLVDGAAVLRAGIREAHIADDVCTAVTADRSVDAVVLPNRSSVSIEDAARCLVPGGVLYGEVDRRSPSTLTVSPRSIRASLRRAGLTLTGLYWIRPDLARRQSYVPLHIAGPLDWYLRSLFTASSPAEYPLALALNILSRLGTRAFAALAPCFAFTAVAGAADQSNPPALLDGGKSLAIGVPAYRSIVITHGEEAYRRVTILPFAPAQDHPLAVVKLARSPEFNAPTEREQLSLTRIRATVTDQMQRTLPEPLGLLRARTLAVGLESCTRGRSMATLTHRWDVSLGRKQDELRRAVSWLTQFHTQPSTRRTPWDEGVAQEWVHRPLETYERAFSVTPGERRLFTAVRARAGALAGSSLPTVWVHGDLSEENVLRCGDDVAVIDWESCRPGPPLVDLLFLTTHWSFSARSLNTEPARLPAYRRLLDRSPSDDPVIKSVRAAIDAYTAALSVDPRFEPVLHVVMWCVRAVGRFGDHPQHIRQQSDSPDRPDVCLAARRDNRFVGYVGVLAERVDELFPEMNVL